MGERLHDLQRTQQQQPEWGENGTGAVNSASSARFIVEPVFFFARAWGQVNSAFCPFEIEIGRHEKEDVSSPSRKSSSEPRRWQS